MAKRELKVTLETVTPMFMAGINQNAPELRPPSILGPLRYWLRAALGAVVGNNLDALKRAEAEVFGDTGGTGAVSIRVPQANLEPDKYNPLPHKRNRFTFDGFKSGQNFTVHLIQRNSEDATWLAAISALLLMVSIGGLGRRCRRGWGTVRIIEIGVSNSGLNPMWKDILEQSTNAPPSAKKWFDYLNFSVELGKHCATELSKSFEFKSGKIETPSPYTIAFPEMVTTVVTQSVYSSEVDAIRVFHQEEHRFGVTEAFGSANPRQGSPLWVRVLPVTKPQQGYVLGMTFFNTRLANDNQDARYIKKFLNHWDSVGQEKKQ